MPGGWRAVGYAVLVHALLAAMLFVGLRWSDKSQAPPVQAYLAGEPAEPVSRKAPEPPPRDTEAEEAARRAEQERARRQEQERRAAEEQKKRAEAKRRVEEEKRRVEEQRRAEEKKRAEEQKRRLAEEKKRAEAQRREAEAQRRTQAERELKEQLAAEVQAREQAVREARVRGEVGHYTELVRQRVSRNWSRPPAAASGLKCTVFVRVAPGGEVLEARIARSSGDVAFDRSVVNAVYKAVPLPVPSQPEVFEAFRELTFVFKPEE